MAFRVYGVWGMCMYSGGLGYIVVFWGMCVVVRVCEMVRVHVRWLEYV